MRKQQKTIWVRADASAELGAGHLVRCGELEDRLGAAAVLVTRDTPLARAMVPASRAVRWLSHDDSSWPHELVLPGDAAVLDLKQLTLADVVECKDCGAVVAVIEDAGPAGGGADLLVDCNRDPADAGKDPGRWFGPDYALLRREIIARRVPPTAGAVRNVLVTMGGGDDAGAALSLANMLANASLCVTLALGWHQSPPPEPPTGVERIRPAGYPDALAGCDCAVVSGGVAMWEALCLGKPVVVLPLHGEQEQNARRLAGTVDVAPVGDVGAAAGLVLALRENLSRAGTMARRGWELVDGRGMDRLLAWLAASR